VTDPFYETSGAGEGKGVIGYNPIGYNPFDRLVTTLFIVAPKKERSKHFPTFGENVRSDDNKVIYSTAA
jgi:hypothetical protein